jgi:predicted ribosome quality control (RQC) complex YloA/Tae2 family protein
MAVEFMGKYSNVILYNAQNKNIIGVMHNVSSEKSSVRELYGGIKYIYPILKDKLDILKISYATYSQFKNIKEISDNFYYLNQALLEKIEKDNKLDFNFLQELTSLKNPEYICSFWVGDDINNSIDNYFSSEMFKDIMKSKKTKLKNLLSKDLKKLNSNIQYPPDDKKMQKIKADADELMFKGEIKEAQKLYLQYKKAKTELIYSKERYDSSLEKANYLEEILFSIDNAQDFDELFEIEEELNIKIKNKNVIPKITKIEYKGWDIYIGKNNKQNDYLISKIASGEDLWFHGLNYPSAHIILRVPNNKKAPAKEIIEYCAKLTKDNSKAKDGGKASVIMTKRKNLKKPPNTYLGYVTYKNETEIVI